MIDISHNPGKKQWDDYAAGNRAALFSHPSGWGETLGTAYSLPTFRLAAVNKKSNRISGILSLVLFSPPGGERRLISLPYTDAAGILADDWESSRRLLHSALDLADDLGAAHLELRQAGNFPESLEGLTGSWLHTAYNFKTGLRRTLSPSKDELWSDLSPKVRNQIRKARRSGCAVKSGGEELVPDFYNVFSENMRDLGSPVHSPELFQNLLRCRSIRTAVIVIYLKARPAAAAILLHHGTTLFNPWASSLRCYRPSCPNMLLYWAMMEYAIAKGCNWFDFGRSSPDASTCRFKRQWGARMEPLVWHVLSRVPQRWDPRSESLEHEDWKRLDLDRSRREGPHIRRWISL